MPNARRAVERLQQQRADREAIKPRPAATAASGAAGDLDGLSHAECMASLKTRHVGRLVYIARAEAPDVVPVNYIVDEDDRILLRTGPGPKMQAAIRHARVAFEVDDINEHARTGWSVVIAGTAELVTGREAEQLSNRVRPPWEAGPRQHIVRITPQRVSGRRLH